MKRHLLILCILLGLVGTRASAYDFKLDGIYYNIVSVTEFTCEVTSGDVKYAGDIEIPATVSYNNRTVSVVRISGSAFIDCTGLTSITIPESVTSIGSGAFDGCTGLTNITIPKSVTSIEDRLFSGCSNLKTVVLPESITNIGEHAFVACSSLVNFNIPESVTSIGRYVFKNCYSLTNVYIPNSVTSISLEAFYNCYSLTSISIPNSVTDIAPLAFYGCNSLTRVSIGNSVASIGVGAFDNCAKLTELIVLSTTPPIIDESVFMQNHYESVDVLVPAGALEIYRSDAVWNSFNYMQAGSAFVEGITLDKETLYLEEGSSIRLTATIFPNEGTDKTIKWSSNNNRVATVGNGGLRAGVVTAESAGTAIITAKAGKHTAKCTVTVGTVVKVEVTGITLNYTTASLSKKGDAITLVATIYPENAADKTVIWKSNDESIATVSDDGVVTAISEGSTFITAETANGYTARCEISVYYQATATIASGEYYLYNTQTQGFLTRGEYFGTCACVDKYGIPFYWDSDKGSIRFLDNNLFLYEADPTYIYTDSENSTGFQFVKKDGGYCLESLKTSTYLTLAEGSHGLRTLTTTSDIDAATVWVLKSKTEHDAIVTGYTIENYEHVIAAAGISTTSGKFIKYLSECKATDVTSCIGTARFTGSVGDWTYNETRAQVAQPVYGIDFCELWQATGSYTQTFTGLPKGIYKVTMQGFERSGGYAQCNALGEKGYEITTAYLKANNEQVNLQSWYSGKDGTNYPNNTVEAVDRFLYGYYMNELYTYVGDDGKLTLTVNKPSHVGDNWVLFNNLTLTHYQIKNTVTGITLDRNAVTLNKGEMVTLVANISSEDATGNMVTWTSSNTNVATVNNGVVRAVSFGTATITAMANGFTATCVISVTSDETVLPSGEYYLYSQTQSFLSRGEYFGTCACVDKYGIPFYWDSNKGSIRFLDNDLYLYEADPTYIYTDSESSTGFRFVEKDGGYCLESLITLTYLTLAEGSHGLITLTTTSDINAATVWLLSSKEGHDAIVSGYTTKNYEHVIAAAGINSTSDKFIEYLSTCKTTDMTLYIGTARFAGNVGNWTYNEVRAQEWQPAYGTDFCELWQATGSYTQTITGLPKGIYKVTMQGFERSGGYTRCNALGESGYEITTATLKANGEEVNLKSWYSGKSDVSNPNNTTEAVAKFEAGEYMNELYTYVGDDGKLTLTVNKPSHVGDNWVLFNNFTLTLYEEEVKVTGITLDKTKVKLTEWESVILTATVSPENATDKTLTWTSSDQAVAVVQDGVVIAISAGTATITARAGNHTATCTVTVIEADGIENCKAEDDTWPADIYDITGRMLKKNATSTDDLEKGIYLIKGRKVIIK